MGKTVTLGGERIGSGNNMTVSLHGYERSNHDLGLTVRTSMAPGVLTPIHAEPLLPGSTRDIDLSALVFTLPTVGPMFGLYKIEIHAFVAAARLYQAALHMNMTDIGNNMNLALLPLVEMEANRLDPTKDLDNQQINPSSIWSHLDIRGLGQPQDDSATAVRRFNGIKYLMYWDTVKNFYTNKQEEIGAVIHTPIVADSIDLDISTLFQWQTLINGDGTFAAGSPPPPSTTITLKTNGPQAERTYLEITTDNPITQPYYDPAEFMFTLAIDGGPDLQIPGNEIFQDWDFIVGTNTIRAKRPTDEYGGGQEIEFKTVAFEGNYGPTNPEDSEPQITTFPLSNLDDMRMAILQHPMGTPFIIDKNSPAPYGLSLQGETIGENTLWSKNYSLEGLALKCYQSDLFNNWLQTEWIDAINTS